LGGTAELQLRNFRIVTGSLPWFEIDWTLTYVPLNSAPARTTMLQRAASPTALPATLLFCALLGVLAMLGMPPPLRAGTGDETPVSPIPALSEDDLADGRRLFAIHCARCHGMLGDGGEGPSLKRPRLRHAPDDQALFDVISEGIRGTGMPGTFGPNDTELWRIAGYVRSLGALPAEPLPGDPGRGREIFGGRGGCAACHIAAGTGRGIGPELTDIGLKRNRAYLTRSLIDPDADQPISYDYMTGRINAFLTVRAVSSDGEFEGLRINEDEFSIQVRDLSGAVRSFDKRELLELDRAPGHSLMPGYRGSLDPAEVDDLVAYLMTLRGDS
jgi:putative heme-binding domain-containing protein